MYRRIFPIVIHYALAVLLLYSHVSPQMGANPSKKPPLNTVADIPLHGPAVRFDYQSLDSTTGPLYIAHMNADHLVAFDTATRKVLANIGGFTRVHGVWAVSEIERLFASVTGDHEVAAVDTQTLRTVAKVGPITYPDGIAYAPDPKRVFVSDEHGNSNAVIDAQSYSLIKKIALGGGAGNTVYDSTANRILVAVHEKNEIAAIDPQKLEVTGRYPVSGVKEPHGIALDVENRLGFVAGARNHTLALVDLASMKTLGTYPVGNEPDVLSFDPGLRQLYVSAESGNVWVYREDGEALVAVGNFSMPHAHRFAPIPGHIWCTFHRKISTVIPCCESWNRSRRRTRRAASFTSSVS
jgi:DNA-binding beta-propeller fold protein YncE